MSGIAGKFNVDPDRPIDGDRLGAMTRALIHRGPDGEGLYQGPGIGLGHRRLGIIDLVNGSEPLANEDHTIWIVSDGQICNFIELRSELERAGHRFRTESDAEVIVHGYEEWGDRAVERFRGAFSFAVWDEPRRRLLLVRDRVGVKPLYYSVTSAGVTFASEIKALIEDPDVSRGWSPEALDAYLVLQYVPCPRTMFSSVWKLPPGHCLVAEHGRASVKRYWNLTFTGDGDPAREREYLDELQALVDESVRLRMIADVPVGAFLSGGLDSSLVTASMVAASGAGRVVATSVGFDDHALADLERARAVARHLGTRTQETVVRPNIGGLLATLAWHLDEPFADPSAVPTYYRSKAARAHVAVALSGAGGDELWAGHAHHRAERREIAARRWLGPTGAWLTAQLADCMPPSMNGVRSLRRLALSPAEAYARKHAHGPADAETRAMLYTGDFAVEVERADPFLGFRLAYESCASPDPFDRALYVDVKTYLADDVLARVDKMSMAVSLEAREPLIDDRLLQFVASVPSKLKLRNGRSKYLLRRALERRVPRRLIDQGDQNAAAPIGEWLRGPLAPLVDALLCDGRLSTRGVFDDRSVKRLWNEHRAGLSDHRGPLWSLVMLELWFRQFVDDPARRSTLDAAA